MTDNEIHNCIDGKVNENYQRIEKLFASLTKMIASDNQEIRISIDNLRVKVEQQNSSVKHLNEWRAEVTGRSEGIKEFKRERLSTWQMISLIVGIFVSSIAIMGFVKSMDNSKSIEETNYRVHWKQDRTPDSTVRSLHILQDSI